MNTLMNLQVLILSATPYGDRYIDAPNVLRSLNPMDWLLFIIVWFPGFIIFEVVLPLIDYIMYSGEPAAVALVVVGILWVLKKTIYAYFDPDVSMFGYTD
jgi:hypothetical protein